MFVLFLIAAVAPAQQRIERPIVAEPVPLRVATRGMVEDGPRLEYDLRDLLTCDLAPAGRQPRLCYSIANLDHWEQREQRERKEDRLMEEAIDQAKQEESAIPWR